MATYSEHVEDQYFRPLVGVVVTAFQDGVSIATTTTDQFGDFTLTVPAGQYRVEYRLNGSLVRVDEVLIGSGFSVNDQEMPPSDVTQWQAWLNGLVTNGLRGYIPGGRHVVGALTFPANLDLEFGTEAILARNPADTNPIFITGSSGLRLRGTLRLEGQAASTATAHTLIAFDGCYDVSIDEMDLSGAKQVGGSYGGLFVFTNGTDYANGTRSRFGDMKLWGQNLGTYGAQFINSQAFDIGFCKGSGCPNAVLAIHNFQIPVPAGVTQSLFTLAGYRFWNAGIGLEMFGLRSGVGINGDIIALQTTNGLFQVGPGEVYDCTVYGVAIQATEGQIGPIMSKRNGSNTSNGGLLLNVLNSQVGPITSDGDYYFGVDAGFSYNTDFESINIFNAGQVAGGCIGINLGATQFCRIKSVMVTGMPTNGIGVRLSGLDGAGAHNWAGWFGVGTRINDGLVYLTNAAQVGVQVTNGFAGSLINVRTIGTVGRPYEYKSAGNNNKLGPNTEVMAPLDGSTVLSVASTGALVIPDNAQDITITGTASVNTIKFQSDVDANARPILVVATAQGSGYTAATTIAVTGDGTGAIVAFPATTGDGKLVGAELDYSAASGNWTTATAVATDSGGGTGATLVVLLGGAQAIKNRKLSIRLSSTATLVHNTSGGPGSIATASDIVGAASGRTRVNLIADANGIWNVATVGVA